MARHPANLQPESPNTQDVLHLSPARFDPLKPQFDFDGESMMKFYLITTFFSLYERNEQERRT